MKLAWLVYRLEYPLVFCYPLFSFYSKERKIILSVREYVLYIFIFKIKKSIYLRSVFEIHGFWCHTFLFYSCFLYYQRELICQAFLFLINFSFHDFKLLLSGIFILKEKQKDCFEQKFEILSPVVNNCATVSSGNGYLFQEKNSFLVILGAYSTELSN